MAGWRWLINERGYANVAQSIDAEETSGTEKEVWGMVYELMPADEESLDRSEGVPYAYEKERHEVEHWEGSPKSRDGEHPSGRFSPVTVQMLVYVDRHRITPSAPKQEYVYRMNRGIEDALLVGVPVAYMDGDLRLFIPDDAQGSEHETAEHETMKLKAGQQAQAFTSENDDEKAWFRHGNAVP